MGVPEFYLNVLTDSRRDTFEFLLCLYQYVLEKERCVYQLQSALPAKFHPRFSPDTGDAVMYFMYKFSQKIEFASEVNAIVAMLQSEQSTEIPSIRHYVLRLANENLKHLKINMHTDRSLGYRDLLIHFVTQYSDDRNIKRSYQEKLRHAVSSPAMNQLRKVLDFYGMHLNQKDPKSYLKFYACISALLLKIDSLKLNDFVFEVLGEVENVMHSYHDTFPGYMSIDNYAKFKKMLLTGAGQPME